MFNYMLSFEIADFFNAFFLCFIGIFRCGALCNIGYAYITKLFQLIFLFNVLQIYQTFLEVGFALERIKAFSTKGVNSQMKFRYQVAIMMIVAIITTLPNYLVTRSIVPFGILSGTNQILYQISQSNFFQDKHWTIFLFVFALVRTLFLYI